MCCCLFSSDPIEDERGIYLTFDGPNKFKVQTLHAPFRNFFTFLYCLGQFFPLTCGITQYMLRRKILKGDMTKYSCFQGQFDCCCIKSGELNESSCPNFCLCLEAHCCNGLAISASRNLVMFRYSIQSDPLDYQLIRCNNFLQLFSCICDFAAGFNENLRDFSRILDFISNIFFHCVTGCMTAQVAYEMDWQNKILDLSEAEDVAVAVSPHPSAPLLKNFYEKKNYNSS